MPNITNIPAPRVPFVDQATGLISREWYRFLLNLFTLTGSGTIDISVTDLAVAPAPADPLATVGSLVDQAQLSTVVAQYSQFLDDLAVQPALQPFPTLPDDLSPRYELGTMAAQNAENVSITGGSITGITFGGLPAGAVAAPSLYWSTDTATGFYRIGSNNIGFSVSGTKRVDFSSTGCAVTGTVSATGNVSAGAGGDGALSSLRSNNTAAVATAINITRGTGAGTGFNVSTTGDAANGVANWLFRKDGTTILDLSAGSATVTGTLSSTGALTTPGGATFHTTSTALTNGAAAAVGTLLNAPAAGNPTKWIGINDNGTTRYIPAW